MRRAPFVGYKIPAPASAHCAMQPERSRYASASFKPFGERGGAGWGGTPSAARIAARLGTSARTRQRRSSHAWQARFFQSGTMVGFERTTPRVGRNTRMQRARPSQGGTMVRRKLRNVLARENHRPLSGPISPKEGRWSSASAQRLGLGETPAFQTEIWVIAAQRPCSGEMESRREGPTPLPAETPRPFPVRTSQSLPSRDVVQKCGQFPAPTARILPKRDDDRPQSHIIPSLEKPSQGASPSPPRRDDDGARSTHRRSSETLRKIGVATLSG